MPDYNTLPDLAIYIILYPYSAFLYALQFKVYKEHNPIGATELNSDCILIWIKLISLPQNNLTEICFALRVLLKRHFGS